MLYKRSKIPKNLLRSKMLIEGYSDALQIKTYKNKQCCF